MMENICLERKNGAAEWLFETKMTHFFGKWLYDQ